MTPGSREEKNSTAFLDHVAAAGGYQLRPPGYLTLEMIGLLDLSIGRGKKAKDALSNEALRDEIHTYLFIQSAPLPTVARAIRWYRRALDSTPRGEAFETWMCDHVIPFLGSLAPEIQAELAEQVSTLDEAVAAQVDAAPPRGRRGERRDPKS